MRSTARSRWWVAIGGALLVASSCSSDSAPSADSLAEAAPGTEAEVVDLAEGAFERNETSQGGDETSAGGDGAEDPQSTAADGTTEPGGDTPADDGSTGDGGGDGSGGDSGDGGSDDGGSGGDSGDGDSGSGSSGGGDGGGGATGTTTTSAPGSGDGGGVSAGVVQIGGVMYPFEADTCEFEDGEFVMFGYGTASDGSSVEVGIFYESFDFDGDGVDETSLDITVDPDVPTGVDLSTLPEFYASKVDAADFSEGEDITVTLDGGMISGAGPIEDFNGVAVAVGKTLPMTFEARCA